MNPALQQLKDIHLPQAISWWPTAPGWIILYVLALGALVYFIYGIFQKRKQRYRVKYALQRLHQLQALMRDNPQRINIAAELSTLIRRTALSYFHRDAIAGLTGQQWLQFLNESGKTTDFTTEAGQILIDAPYRKNSAADLTPLFVFTEKWLTAISSVSRKES